MSDDGTEASPEDAESFDSLPEHAQKMIRSLRAEAGAHRRKATLAADEARESVQKETHDQVTALKREHKEHLATLEKDHKDTLAAVRRERNAASNERDQAQSELRNLRTALDVGVPAEQVSEFATRLRGDTDEELQADAERLKDAFGVAARRGDPSQGRQGSPRQTDHALTNFFLGHQ